jgi:hypothetical protein
MRALLFLFGGMAAAGVVWATWDAPAQGGGKEPAPVVSSATQRGQDPWAANEPRMEAARMSARRSLLAVLDKPWTGYCSDAGHRQLVDSIGYYYWMRGGQMKSYPKNYGEAGKRHIARAWATPDDNRIERRTRETYGRGYFVLEEIAGSARAAVAEQVRGERKPSHHPCAT